MTVVQENEMMVINFVNVATAKFTLATFPPRFHMEPWNHEGGDVRRLHHSRGQWLHGQKRAGHYNWLHYRRLCCGLQRRLHLRVL